MPLSRRVAGFALAAALTFTMAQAEEAPHAEPGPSDITVARMVELIEALDETAETAGSTVRFRIADRPLMFVYDETSRRMRIMTAVAPEASLEKPDLLRLMQANFDSALDARYAIAQSVVWSVFIHPLDGLSEAEFVSAISQTATLALTYGSTFSSGSVVFGGGDSQGLLEDELKDTLKEKGVPI
ncbi:MAG: hypothetical protein AAGL49_01565 [Pseudomonadota bacterium]